MIAEADALFGLLQPQANHSSMSRGLLLLLQAYEYALDLGQDHWAFALEIQSLMSEGMTRSELRWLRCKGVVEHATEITSPGDSGRIFEPALNLKFNKSTCFIMTGLGLALARSRVGEPEPRPCLRVQAATAVRRARLGVPAWDTERHELRFDDFLVKRFKAPAPNQEAVLCAFEEESWPVRIDDPIPPRRDQDPKRRLHDTINALNRNHFRRVIHFIGDGSGLGVRWELLTPTGEMQPHWEPNGKASE